MKKTTLLSFITFLSMNMLFAQLPVSHTQENRNVLLEEYTGMHCTWCPAGHKIASQMKAAHPDDVFISNVHVGGYATPGSGEPDYRTPFGTAFASGAGVHFYPSGSVNRHVFSGNATAMSRTSWSSSANQVMGEASYCNVALEATVDTQTREMTINVEVYYTGNSSQASNYLNVALLQDNVEGIQVSASRNPTQILPIKDYTDENYNHMHMLRHMITGQWGDEITTTSQGTLIQRQYTYTLPADIRGIPLEMGNLELVAFVAEGHQEVVTANSGPITYTNFAYTSNAVLKELYIYDEICSAGQIKPILKVRNFGSSEITAMTITYDMNGNNQQTLNWTGSILKLQKKFIELPQFSFPVQSTNVFHVAVSTVNGAADENPADNLKTFNIAETTNTGEGTDYVVTIVQDRYGSETTWGILDDNGNVLAGGGPYGNLPANGTQTHTHNVTLNDTGCYTFLILDAYGDGINGTYGNGSYKMETATGDVVFQGSGVFGQRDRKPFTTTVPAGINDNYFAGVKIYPNPSTGNFIFENVSGMNLEIFDMMGARIYEKHDLVSSQSVNLDKFSSGVYFVKLQKETKTILKKIIITK